MKRWLIGGFVGAIVGFVGGYFFGGMNCAKHYRNRIEELEDENERLLNETAEETGENAENDSSPSFIVTKSYTNSSFKPTTGFLDPKRIRKSDYDDMTKVYRDPADTEDERADIHIISEQQFKDDLNYRDNETLTWYKEDGVLADSADMPIHSEEDVIGVEALDKLENMGDDEFLYVSNDIEDKMYEIIVEGSMSYYRDIVGG